MNLTFKGFLRSYCRELTGLNTDNLSKLVKAAASNAPAAAEAVFVFAAVQGKASYATKLARGAWLQDGYEKAAEMLSDGRSVESFLESDETPERYKKVLAAYRARKTAIEADRRVIALMREKTLAALEASGASIYCVCKQLNLNKGNIYAYLNGGDASKVSRSTARRIMKFADSL